MRRLKQSIHVLRFIPGEVVDGYGSEDTWAEPVEVAGCAIAPGDVVEPFEANREGASVSYTIYAPPGTKVAGNDRLLVPGEPEPLDAVGAGREWVSPFSGRPWGVVIRAGRFDG